ncbi:MAG: linear primary-alkylsulfatase, partial [Paraburkholderia sp.]|nr:linear primary-alkylsulfatase [Paraburkholderia sp.]
MKKQKRYQQLTAVAVAVTTLCMSHAAFSLTAAPNKDATAITKQENAEVYKQLPFDDKQDFEDAQRGFIATIPNGVIKTDDGGISWSLNKYKFL